jgi:hypothetical protein
MIKILFPPGCYGTYFSRCLYSYTSLSSNDVTSFDFDATGSSHEFRENQPAKSLIWLGHLNSFISEPEDTIITILPDSNHCLDYYNNQFIKQEKGALISYLKLQISKDDIKYKLLKYWNYEYTTLDDQIPTWILREWFSFWIQHCWDDGYNINSYKQITSKLQISTQDIFENIFQKLTECATIIGKKLRTNSETILFNHSQFIKNQKFHNAQVKCQHWVDQILYNETEYPSPCITIFDESYVQYLLRNQNFEIQCDQLNKFPLSSLEMKKIIYKS